MYRETEREKEREREREREQNKKAHRVSGCFGGFSSMGLALPIVPMVVPFLRCKHFHIEDPKKVTPEKELDCNGDYDVE